LPVEGAASTETDSVGDASFPLSTKTAISSGESPSFDTERFCWTTVAAVQPLNKSVPTHKQAQPTARCVDGDTDERRNSRRVISWLLGSGIAVIQKNVSDSDMLPTLSI
jgi:hypothetical protein